MRRWLFENPVLQRELLVQLRQPLSFVVLGAYLLVLGLLVYSAWPQDLRLEMHVAVRPESSRRLVNLFLFSQYLLASLIVPSFAAASIAGEKERRTLELLLTTPLRPAAIISGKLLTALCYMLLLLVGSLPIITLCLPLGGTSWLELLATYFAMFCAVSTFGLMSLAWSSYFRRTMAALLVSYLSILPLALLGALVWGAFESGAWLQGQARLRLFLTFSVLPVVCGVAWAWLLRVLSQRLTYPPDLGSEGREVFDEEEEMRRAVGLVIRRDQFPDRLFAPPRRTDLLPDGANPVYDKEIHSEIFSQGTLMLRIVIQVSMVLALPLMAVFLFFATQYTPEYVAYVLLFNLLVGPVFSAGAITSERERGTLDLLLTTILSPWTILWGKLVSSLRISTVLTGFLVWPILLAAVLEPNLWPNWRAIPAYLAIILITCITTATLGLFMSVLLPRTTLALLVTYLVILVLFFGPLAAATLTDLFYEGTRFQAWAHRSGLISPFAAAFGVPLEIVRGVNQVVRRGVDWPIAAWFIGCYAVADAAMVLAMAWLFRTRWRVAD